MLFLFRASLISVGLAAVVVPTRLAAIEPWPGEPNSTALVLPLLDPLWAMDMSGAYWNKVTRTFWVADNGDGAFWALVEDGAGSWRIATNGSGTKARWVAGGDFEGICQANDNEPVVYVLDENSSIRKYDVSVNGVVNQVRAWNISPIVPEVLGFGAESITFVPDYWLQHCGFRDGDGVLRTSSGGLGGLMFVGTQTGGYIHVFDLDPNSTSYSYYGKLKTSREEATDLFFDRDTGKFYIWHNIGRNYLEVAELSSAVAGTERRFRTLVEYEGPRTGNLEGMALALEDGMILLTDDNNLNNEAVVIYRNFSLHGDTDGDGLNDDWELQHFGSTAVSVGLGDADGDGDSDLVEFAFDGDPLDGARKGRVHALTVDTDEDLLREFVLSVAVRSGTPVFAGTPSPSASHEGLSITVSGSANLVDGSVAVEGLPTAVTPGLEPPGVGYEYRSFRLVGSNGLGGRGFLRVGVTLRVEPMKDDTGAVRSLCQHS